MGCMNLPRGALVTVLPIPLRLKLIDFAQQPQLQPPGWNPSMLILLPRVFAQPRPEGDVDARIPIRSEAIARLLVDPQGRYRLGPESFTMPVAYRPARAEEIERAEELVVRSINDLTERHGFRPMASLRPPQFQLFCLSDDPEGLWVA